MANNEPTLNLILGGARSGKSAYAEALASQFGPTVLYVATAEALDEEMEARIAAHRAARPAAWTTLEAPLNVGAALRAHPAAAGADAILLDCLTLLVSNLLLVSGADGPELDVESAWERVRAEVDGLVEVQRELGVDLIIVSNEVGSGVVPPYSLGRAYRDCLGWANQALVRAADRVVLLVAGLPVDLKALPLARLGTVS